MNLFPPLLADIGDLIIVVVGILFVIVSVIGQMVVRWREAQQAGQRPRGARPNVPQRQGPLEDEIRDFLRRAAERRPGGVVQPAGKPAAPRPAGARLQPPKSRQTPPAERPLEAELVPSEVGQLRKSLTAQKPRRLGAELGKEVAHADNKMQSHVHQVFDHQLSALEGALGDSAEMPAVKEPESAEDQITSMPSTAAAGLAAMFANADSVRQAILINEILQRPEHRWS